MGLTPDNDLSPWIALSYKWTDNGIVGQVRDDIQTEPIGRIPAQTAEAIEREQRGCRISPEQDTGNSPGGRNYQGSK